MRGKGVLLPKMKIRTLGVAKTRRGVRVSYSDANMQFLYQAQFLYVYQTQFLYQAHMHQENSEGTRLIAASTNLGYGIDRTLPGLNSQPVSSQASAPIHLGNSDDVSLKSVS